MIFEREINLKKLIVIISLVLIRTTLTVRSFTLHTCGLKNIKFSKIMYIEIFLMTMNNIKLVTINAYFFFIFQQEIDESKPVLSGGGGSSRFSQWFRRESPLEPVMQDEFNNMFNGIFIYLILYRSNIFSSFNLNFQTLMNKELIQGDDSRQ